MTILTEPLIGYNIPINYIPGASPSASATVNTLAIQTALTAAGTSGGMVELTIPGTYLYNATLIVYANTSIVLGAGVDLKCDPSVSKFLMLKNFNSQIAGTPVAVTALTTTNGKAVNVQAAAHGYAAANVGNTYVWIAGAIQDSYNGIWPITAIVDANNFTILISNHLGTESPVLTSPATGTIYYGTADVNISLSGSGTWNGNRVNMTNTNTYQDFGGVFFRHVKNLRVDGVRFRDNRDCINMEGVYSGWVTNCQADSTEATGADSGIGSFCQIRGPNRSITVRGNRTQNADDSVAYLGSDADALIDSGFLIGTVDDITVDDLTMENGYRAVKILGNKYTNAGVATNATLGTFRLNDIKGKSVVATAMISIGDDYTTGAGGGTITSLVISKLAKDFAYANIGIDIALPCTNVVINDSYFQLDGAASIGVQANIGAVIESLTVSTTKFVGNTNGIAIQGNNGGAATPTATGSNVAAGPPQPLVLSSLTRCVIGATVSGTNIGGGAKIIGVNAGTLTVYLDTINTGTVSNGTVITVTPPTNVKRFKIIGLDSMTTTYGLNLGTGVTSPLKIDVNGWSQNGCSSLLRFTGQTGMNVGLCQVSHDSFTGALIAAVSGSPSMTTFRVSNCPGLINLGASWFSGTWGGVTAFWDGRYRNPVTWSASVTPDYKFGNVIVTTVNATATVNAITNLSASVNQDGQQVCFEYIWDGTGGAYVITHAAAYIFSTVFVQHGVATDALRTVIEMTHDGNGKYRSLDAANSWN